jgi:phosphonate transport system ATP-binding protein
MSGFQSVIDVQSISKTFYLHKFGRQSGKALDKVNLKIDIGEMVALIGPSGSGKSTLLRHLSGLVPSDAAPGTIALLGQIVQRNGHISPNIRHLRAEVGFIFQQFNLVGRLPLLTNVLVGMLPRVPLWRSLLRYFTDREKREAMQALARVGMAEFATQRASTLSGGQQQRGAIARAMVQQAQIILADEPIASLDPESSRNVMESLAQLNQEDGVTILVSLHQIDFAMRYCPRSIALKQGSVVYDGATDQLTVAKLQEIYGPNIAEFYDQSESASNVLLAT